jgi:hypothetical protein
MNSKFDSIAGMVKVRNLFPWYVVESFVKISQNLYGLKYKGAILEINLIGESILIKYSDSTFEDFAENKISMSGSTVEIANCIELFFKKYLSVYLFERLIPLGYFGFAVTQISDLNGKIQIQIKVKDNFGYTSNLDAIEVDPNSQEGQIARLILVSQGGYNSLNIDLQQSTTDTPTLDHEKGLFYSLQGVLFQLVSNQKLMMEQV